MPVELFVRLGLGGIADAQVRVDPRWGGRGGESGEGVTVGEEFG